MKKILTICDLYGDHFHWYIDFKPKYYTYYGGIFSILSLLSIIIIFILFGYDDFKRNNPNSNTSTVPPSGYKNIKFGQEKLYLPWRIIDYDENSINITGIIYPKIFYFTVHPDNITGELITKYNLINYKLCNETSMKYLGKEHIIDIPIETLYCIDMEDLKVGGSWNSDFLNFIRFDLYMCKDGIDYNETNSKCTTYESLDKKIGGGESVFFELLYPVVQFQPTNINIPILLVYKTHYYILNKFTNKLDRLYLQEHVFEDEQSWVFNRPKNISYWGINSINGESYIRSDRDVLRFASSSKLYTLNIYFELGIIYYTRKYKKLYEILGEIFPIISAVCSFFSFISRVLNELKIAKALNEYIIGYDFYNKKQPNNIYHKNSINYKSIKPLKTFGEYNKNKSLRNNSFNIYKKKNTNTKEDQLKQIINISNVEDSSKIFCNQNNINININPLRKKFNRKINNSITNKNKINQINNINTINNINNFRQKNEKYPLYYYFFGYLYSRLNFYKNKNNNNFICITRKFYKSFSFFKQLIDISTFLSIYQEFKSFKEVLKEKLNTNETGSVQSDSKYNINRSKKILLTDNNKVNRYKIISPIEIKSKEKII